MIETIKIWVKYKQFWKKYTSDVKEPPLKLLSMHIVSCNNDNIL